MTFRRLTLILGLGCRLLTAAEATPRDFYQAIRENNLTQLRSLLASGASADLRDPRGNTPLMHAASIGTVEAMQVLLKAGADANAKNGLDVTPLVLGATNLAKVKLLLDAGAQANAVTNLRRTPLMIAAGHPGGTAIVKLLLDKGADPSIMDVRGGTALLSAVTANNTDAVRLLLDRSSDPKQGRDIVGFTVLHEAAAHSNIPVMKLLLAKGVDVNAAPKGEMRVRNGAIAISEMTPLMVASPRSSLETVQTLLAAGADVKPRDVRGMTALMFAVASDSPNPEVVRLLLDKGSDRAARSTDGQSVLDWARKYGDSRVLALLGGQTGPGAKPHVVPAASVTPPTAQVAVERANQLLMSTSKEYFRMSGCSGCHHQPVIAMAAGASRKAGVAGPDDAFVREQSQVIKAELQSQRNAIQQDLFISADSLAFGLIGLAALDYPADDVTDTVVAAIAARQTEEGDFLHVPLPRPPLEDSQFVAASIAANAIRHYTIPARRHELEARLAKVRHWLTVTHARTPYEQSFRLMGLAWSGADAQTLRKAAEQVLRLQRPDGGWPQLATLESDAFGTAAALHGLRLAGTAISHAGYRRGVQYLLARQYSDGSWYVASRPPKIQPYFEGGFPHGHDQWISVAATAFAVTALSESLEPAVKTAALR